MTGDAGQFIGDSGSYFKVMDIYTAEKLLCISYKGGKGYYLVP